jgi:apolipoprotein N-acyltransferase
LRIWNSLDAVDDAGKIVANYDKSHLVPFGEYVPLRAILPIGKIVGGAVDFSAGHGPRTIELPGLPPASPLICYEAIFPGAVVDAAHRPDWLLNVTNDGWYGISSGPYQHFAAARMRAVEEGLPLVRAANTGISGIVDPYGRITESLELGARGVVDGALPKPLPPTLFARLGNGIALGLMALFGLAALLIRRQAARS